MPTSNHHNSKTPSLASRSSKGAALLALAATIMATAMMALATSCNRKEMPRSYFATVPHSWNKEMSLTFTPQCADSLGLYDVTLAIRHNNQYQYSNLCLVVDIISSNGTVDRRTVNFELADANGNWQGTGFGTLYQNSVKLATGLRQSQLKHVVVWQGMNGCKQLQNVENIGIIVSPSKQAGSS